jgi:peptide/nickel transport system permease protein
MAATATVRLQRRSIAIRRALAPIAEARGLARTMLWTGAGITFVFCLLAIFAPVLSPYGFDTYQSGGRRFPQLAHPGHGHILGTTVQSTDVLSRIVWGTQTELEVVGLALAFGLVIGVPLGLFAGYFGGPLDRGAVLFMDAMFAFPPLLLAIVIAFLLGSSVSSGVLVAALAITITYVPQYFRVVRNSTLSAREQPYVEAARAIGAPPRVLITRYIFGNVVQSVPVIATLNAGDAILTLAGLGFLGYGIDQSAGAEWGAQLSKAISDTGNGVWWTGLFPGLAIVLIVVGVTLVGESLNDVLNPLLRTAKVKQVVLPPRGAQGSAEASDV